MNGTRTYIGSTTDPERRLRQHNGELRGGARSTRGGSWQLVMYIEGFENRSAACRWERILKCRARGLAGRRRAMMELFLGICPRSRNGRKDYEVPTGLTVFYE